MSFQSSSFDMVSSFSNGKTSCRVFCTFLVAVSLVYCVYYLGTGSITKDYRERMYTRGANSAGHKAKSRTCQNRCRPPGSEALPEKIVQTTTNFRLHSVSGSYVDDHIKPLLAIPVGIKQKTLVNEIVRKFLASDFVVMLFHYDGVVDKWYDLASSDSVIHVAALNQTKWWFAKRFLHPDVVADYSYIFLWDEDIGVKNFAPKRYLSIIKEEHLEISQPALDPVESRRVHHAITARKKKSRVHRMFSQWQQLRMQIQTLNRRMHKLIGSGRCYGNSTAPPCTGWVELMVPVFSQNAWRCVWHMIQNDLIHAWGLDKQLGYCAQGDRVRNVGVVDSEYVVHLGLPTLGTPHGNEVSKEVRSLSSPTGHSSNPKPPEQSIPVTDFRIAVREQSSIEMKIFRKRWSLAVREDECWIDPYHNSTSHHN